MLYQCRIRSWKLNVPTSSSWAKCPAYAIRQPAAVFILAARMPSRSAGNHNQSSHEKATPESRVIFTVIQELVEDDVPSQSIVLGAPEASGERSVSMSIHLFF